MQPSYHPLFARPCGMVSQDCDHVHRFDRFHENWNVGSQEGQFEWDLRVGMNYVGDPYLHQPLRNRGNLTVRQLAIAAVASLGMIDLPRKSHQGMQRSVGASVPFRLF